ncbi:hypothetical protein L7F22_049184 [Adiantum nelumboides]|nr:hypothetical protein [Adiantum nelumboides]
MKMGHFIKDCPDLKPQQAVPDPEKKEDFQPVGKRNAIRNFKNNKASSSKNRNGFSPLLEDVFDPLVNDTNADVHENSSKEVPSQMERQPGSSSNTGKEPRGFVKKGQEDKVCKCHKALYGLKLSPRAWYEKVDTHLVKGGFCNIPTESTLYVKREGDVLLIVVLYVDDLLIIGPNEGHIAEFKADLNATFKMKDLGLLHHYLGIQFKQCDGGIALCQKSYIETLLCKFGLFIQKCKQASNSLEWGKTVLDSSR